VSNVNVRKNVEGQPIGWVHDIHEGDGSKDKSNPSRVFSFAPTNPMSSGADNERRGKFEVEVDVLTDELMARDGSEISKEIDLKDANNPKVSVVRSSEDYGDSEIVVKTFKSINGAYKADETLSSKRKGS
jgi:hypothetical protein